MRVLGINAYHGDAAACLLVDGRIIAAAEEERFRRIKHCAGVPTRAAAYCLSEAGLKLSDIDVIACNRNPRANLLSKALFAASRRPAAGLVRERLAHAAQAGRLKESLEAELGPTRAKVRRIEHHRAHLASAFLASPFEDAAVLSVDGFGDFVSTMLGEGRGTRIRVLDRVLFPHSLGLFYTAFTQYLGFPNYGDEYKLMALAAYGSPAHSLDEILRSKGDRFQLNLDYFVHHSRGLGMTWDSGPPMLGRAYSERLVEKFGPARLPDGPLDARHFDLAASVQAAYERAFFRLLRGLYEKTGNPRLCLAGGCALNSVANGKVLSETRFRELFIQPASSDSGGALGAALEAAKTRVSMDHSYWGPAYAKEEIERAAAGAEFVEDPRELVRRAAGWIGQGRVVGWFQGRMEWGPRALGNRSILADPRRAEMREVLNARIKRREPFRPFAPAILQERVGEYFEQSYPDPFMLKVYRIRPEKRGEIPAATHVDGTGRLQTVSKEANPLFWSLIREFEKLTGVPVVLNTSFNENEPIVCTPEEAVDCFRRTRMDALFIGPFVLRSDGL